TTAASALLAQRYGSRRAGWWTALLFATTPVVILNTSIAMIDFGVAFFAVTSFLVLQSWMSGPNGSLRPLLWSGFMAGMAMACKYTGIYSTAAIGVMIFCVEFRRTHRWETALRSG